MVCVLEGKAKNASFFYYFVIVLLLNYDVMNNTGLISSSLSFFLPFFLLSFFSSFLSSFFLSSFLSSFFFCWTSSCMFISVNNDCPFSPPSSLL